jgi:hypothetical protein
MRESAETWPGDWRNRWLGDVNGLAGSCKRERIKNQRPTAVAGGAIQGIPDKDADSVNGSSDGLGRRAFLKKAAQVAAAAALSTGVAYGAVPKEER